MIALFAGIHLAGGPYALVQAYAWAGMLVSYSKEDGLLQGARNTFSGEKPCALCCEIADAKKSGQGSKDLPVLQSVKLLKDALPGSPLLLKVPRGAELPSVVFAGVEPPVETCSAAPPVPPPRRLV